MYTKTTLKRTILLICAALSAFALAGCTGSAPAVSAQPTPIAPTHVPVQTQPAVTPSQATDPPTTAAAAVENASGLMVVLTNMTPTEDTYVVDAVVQQYQSISPEQLERMLENTNTTITINDQRFYMIDLDTYGIVHPGEQPEGYVGYLYLEGTDYTDTGIEPFYHMIDDMGVYIILSEDNDYRPRVDVDTISLLLAPDAQLTLLTQEDLQQTPVTPDEFYEVFLQTRDHKSVEGYYLSGMHGAGFICDVQDGLITSLEEIYMP